MKLRILAPCALVAALFPSAQIIADNGGAARGDVEQYIIQDSPYRGWDYLVGKLRDRGIPEDRLREIFQNPALPVFSEIPFRIAPRESVDMYRGFRTAAKVAEARAFIKNYQTALKNAEREFGVAPEVIASIFLVETSFGRNTGKEMVLYRLARVSSVGEPNNLQQNFERLKKDDHSITLDQVQARAQYLENTFLPELTALIDIAERNEIDIFKISGSIAGAWGIPQFLPSSYLRFGKDGNADGKISLFDFVDAIYSTAFYFKSAGWHPHLKGEERRAAVWAYNHSQPYVDTILWLTEELQRPPAVPKR